MRRIAVWVLASCISTIAVADEPVVAPELTAAQIVEKNVAARGGLEAWRKIRSMVWVGHIERPNTDASSLSYVLEQKRPNKTRFEIKTQNQKWVRIYDGAHGWKLRPTSNGKPDLQPYTTEELSSAQNGQGIDGPLMDYQAKGIAVILDGVDDVEGNKAYRLNVKFPSGASNHVWIDAQTFLEVKYDRQSRNAIGQTGTVSVYYRDYRTMEGLQIPFTIESGVGAGKVADKMLIDKILLNPPLEDQMFAKPNVPWKSNAVPIDTTSRQPVRRAALPASSLPPEFQKLMPRSVPGFRDAQ